MITSKWTSSEPSRAAEELGGRHVADRTRGGDQADTVVVLFLRGQESAAVVRRGHRLAGKDLAELVGALGEKVLPGVDLHRAGVDVGLVQDGARAVMVVGVMMGIEDRRDGFVGDRGDLRGRAFGVALILVGWDRRTAVRPRTWLNLSSFLLEQGEVRVELGRAGEQVAAAGGQAVLPRVEERAQRIRSTCHAQ